MNGLFKYSKASWYGEKLYRLVQERKEGDDILARF